MDAVNRAQAERDKQARVAAKQKQQEQGGKQQNSK